MPVPGASRADRRMFLVAAVAAAVVVAAVGGLALLLGGEDRRASGPAPPPPTAVAEEPPATAPTLPPGPTAPPDRPEIQVSPVEGGRLPPLDVATLPVDWQVIELPGERRWYDQLVTVGGELWAIGGGYDQESGERALAWSSPDGRDWSPVELPAELAEGGTLTIHPTAAGAVAVLDGWSAATGAPELRVYVTADGQQWHVADLAAPLAPGEHLWVAGAAGADGTLVLAATREQLAPERDAGVITMRHDGMTVEIDDRAGTYHVYDAGSELVAYGSLDRMWGERPNLLLADPVTGATVFTGDFGEFHRVAMVAYEAAVPGERLVVELAGPEGMLAVDELADRVTVTDHEGATTFAGTLEDLWRGPGPSFADPATGEIVVTVPWDVWDAAHGEEGQPDAEAVLLASTGGPFQEASVDSRDGFQLGAVAHGPAGFLAVGARQPPGFGEEEMWPEPVVLRSADGLGWAELTTGLPAGWMHQLSGGAAGYVAIQGRPAGVEIVASVDGEEWETVLAAADLGLPAGSTWFDRVAAGPLGTFVSGGRDGWTVDVAQATISEHGRTLTLAPPVYTLTDDATGEVLARFDEGAGLDERRRIRWGEGGLAAFADDGTVLFAVSHGEYEAAMRDVWAGAEPSYPPEPLVVMLGDDGPVAVALPAGIEPDTWCSGIAVTDDTLVLLTMTEHDHGEDVASLQTRVLAGTPG